MGFDRHLERWVVGHRVGALDALFQGLSYAGSSAALWLALAGMLALVWRRPLVAVSTLAAAVTADLAAFGLKAVIPRARPHADPLVAVPPDHSFPSGHAATSFACATVIAAAAPRARVPLYALAALIAWSRVYVGVHYPLDVLAGGLLGVAVGLCVLRALRSLAAARRR